MNLHIDPSWSFKQIVINFTKIKAEFDGKLSAFSYFKLHDKVLFLKDVKNLIYSLPLQTWQKNKIWDCLNDNIQISDLSK